MIKEVKTIKKREKCGNCYYNGNCNRSISYCTYLNNKKQNNDIEKE